MQTLEYRTIDKSAWPRGEWDNEPDKKQWQDEAAGLPCLIVRNPGGALCGYVGVPEGHPLYKVDSSDWEKLTNLEVHGGITYSDFCADTQDESRHICHKPEPGETDHVWWLGFDCSHCCDIRPKYHGNDRYGDPYASYRSLSYVTSEVESLAKQLAALAH